MQKQIMVALLVLGAVRVHAQTWDEWFRQKKTQVRYLVEQIAALGAYREEINKGYAIAQDGLTHVFTGKQGDYLQHRNYFRSLLTVRPAIKSYSKVALISRMQEGIEKQYQKLGLFLPYLSGEESRYLHAVFEGLLQGGRDVQDQLKALTEDGHLALKDDERLRRIDQLCSEMQDRYSFCCAALKETALLVLGRLKEQKAVEKIRSLYGVQ